MAMDPRKRHLLVILDGYGLAEDPSVSAIDHARKPFLDHLFATYPHATLKASGLAVGLPEGQMGNSEVGHLNLGAGRVVYQEITRIDKEIEAGTFFTNNVLVQAAQHARANDSRLHLMGCFSDGGVHASLNHLFALLELARREGLRPEQVCVHAFTDGRDTDPKSGIHYVQQFQEKAREIGVGRIVSIVGRYYAMDRDKRWDRTEKAYRLLVYGEGEVFGDPIQALEASYAEGITDEFVRPRRIDYGDGYPTRIADGDAVIFYNFRADRARQLTRAFTEANFDAFPRGNRLDLLFVTFTPYDETFDLPVAFGKVNLRMTLGEVISALGGRQLRIAETEKYAHVTYFFSGGREEPFEGEDRILVPSPKVPTYDLKPEMSAPEVARRCAEAIEKKIYNLIVLNFANPDMVGHTGVFEAAVRAIEAVDAATRVVVEAALQHGYTVTILADHGNADRMKNPDGSPHTAHTTALVPHLIIKPGFHGPIQDGKLGDVAPTILRLLGEDIPPEMTGEVLI
ncbi:phosphoglycerate mutase [Rhodothermus profundi]|uniref:2,3-bisphosphoglycerate-independent phosphoglycerate mutase n=2 Tax=Rhodothermus profundi TaxID=633813 RepID=A0A1M6WNA5_9BACT|nr:phosphoglycerate mutase [Rhodothermus profundi]